jgi:murein L,D-transpeptidase YcbB/YkuD
MLQAPTPIYLRYFTAYAADGRIRFLEDIYAEDRLLREKYFTRR